MSIVTTAVLTEERRRRRAEYLRQYRANHPEKTRQWRDTYCLRRAAKLMAEQAGKGNSRGGD